MKPENIIFLLTSAMMLRTRHWQTRNYAEHIALGSLYDSMDEFIDTLVEVSQGKMPSGVRIKFPDESAIALSNYLDGTTEEALRSLAEFLRGPFMDGINDTEIANLRDDMLAKVERTQYLITLQ